MKKIALSPYVYKVKGAKNYLLHDLSRERLFQLTPDGNIDQLRDQLLRGELAVETDGVVPFKYKLDIDQLKYSVELVELEVRLTGICSEECPDCGHSCACYRDDNPERMGEDVFATILGQFGEGPGKVPVKQLVVTGGNPFLETERLKKILDAIGAEQKFVVFKNSKKYSHEVDGCDIIPGRMRGNIISESSMDANDFSFFFRQTFHSCWGKKISLDVNGDIKLCLRHRLSFGNILRENVKKLIVNGTFDPYWELTKDNIPKCKDCEYRYACIECRPHMEMPGENLEKPRQCGYNPNTGEWKTPIVHNILKT